MEEFIKYIVQNLVSHPSDVKVECVQTECRLLAKIQVANEDIGQVVGRKGVVIKALRTIVGTLGARLKITVRLELLQ